MTKRVLVIAHSGDLYGANRSLVKLVKILNGIPLKVFVLIPEEGQLSATLRQLLPAEQVFIRKELFVFTRKDFKILNSLKTFYKFTSDVLFLSKIIRKHKIDLVHTNSGVVPAPALATRISGKKHLWHIREWFGDFNKFWPLYSGYITSLSDKVICVSNSIAEQFGSKSNVVSIYNGFEIPKINSKLSISDELHQLLEKAQLIVGCTSRIKLFRKGQEYLIQALGILKHKGYENIQCLLLGDPVPGYEYHRDVLDKLILENNLQNQVHFLGHVSDPIPYYSLFDLFVLPSGEPEPFGGVVLEAMSLELPVIGSDVGGTVEQIKDGWNGYLYKNQDSGDLAEKILRFLKEPQNLTLFGERSKSRVEELFTLKEHRNKIVNLYQELLQIKN